ncbi:outer membrane protein assembly factor BamD, partial [Alphaproteobacteria bacterium]|nr:outer membrane protein assembly factor BamD [Alphaproteobacteria bacterium]
DLVTYKSALSLSLAGKNDKAAIKFESISNDFPYSNLSSKAQIMAAYSYYENNEIKKTILKLNDFIEMNPSDEFSDYAHTFILNII